MVLVVEHGRNVMKLNTGRNRSNKKDSKVKMFTLVLMVNQKEVRSIEEE